MSSPKVVFLSPAEATKMLGESRQDVPIDWEKVKHLQDEMLEGRYQFDGSPIKVNKNKNIVDGLHRLIALSRINDPSVRGLQFLLMPNISISRAEAQRLESSWDNIVKRREEEAQRAEVRDSKKLIPSQTLHRVENSNAQLRKRVIDLKAENARLREQVEDLNDLKAENRQLARQARELADELKKQRRAIQEESLDPGEERTPVSPVAPPSEPPEEPKPIKRGIPLTTMAPDPDPNWYQDVRGAMIQELSDFESGNWFEYDRAKTTHSHDEDPENFQEVLTWFSNEEQLVNSLDVPINTLIIPVWMISYDSIEGMTAFFKSIVGQGNQSPVTTSLKRKLESFGRGIDFASNKVMIASIFLRGWHAWLNWTPDKPVPSYRIYSKPYDSQNFPVVRNCPLSRFEV